MTVEEKIKESEFFLNRIKTEYADQFAVQCFFSGVLSSTRSIGEHLLEEYNKKYSLGISLGDKLNTDTFRKEAQKQNNTKALQFITWFDQQVTKINQDPVGHFMWQGRNTNIHRETKRPNKMIVTINENVNSGTSNSQVRWCFQELQFDDAYDVSEKFLDIMKNLVVDARKQF